MKIELLFIYLLIHIYFFQKPLGGGEGGGVESIESGVWGRGMHLLGHISR